MIRTPWNKHTPENLYFGIFLIFEVLFLSNWASYYPLTETYNAYPIDWLKKHNNKNSSILSSWRNILEAITHQKWHILWRKYLHNKIFIHFELDLSCNLKIQSWNSLNLSAEQMLFLPDSCILWNSYYREPWQLNIVKVMCAFKLEH